MFGKDHQRAGDIEGSGAPVVPRRCVAPYRYAYQDGQAVPVEAEQATVRLMRALHAAGQSFRAVSAALAAQGRLARNGKPFTAQTVKQVLAAQLV